MDKEFNMNIWIKAILIALGITLFISAIVCGTFYLVDGLMRGARWATYVYRAVIAILGLIMFLLLVYAVHVVLVSIS